MYPKAFSHIGLSVPDLDAAVKFYTEVMGLYVIMPPSVIERDEFRIAHLSTSDGIGFEMFEFPQNEPHEKEFKYWRTSLFHFAVQDPDLEGFVENIVKHGGKQRMPIRYYYKDSKPYRMCYVEDPFGIIFEVYSHSYELTYSSGAYENPE